MVPVFENVNDIPLLLCPPTVTTIGPVVALLGTGTTIALTFQLEGWPATPLKVTMLVPMVGPNPEPEIVTNVPAPPDVGETVVIFGTTVNVTPLLATPPTIICTGPVVAFAGTGTTIVELLQLDGVAVSPLNVTMLEPCDAPKLVPEIVMEVPVVPEVADRPRMAGATTKVPPL
jgi:hypothetical protein